MWGGNLSHSASRQYPPFLNTESIPILPKIILLPSFSIINYISLSFFAMIAVFPCSMSITMSISHSQLASMSAVMRASDQDIAQTCAQVIVTS